MQDEQREQAVNKLLALLAFADMELAPEEYELIEQRPFDAWPRELQDKLRRFGAASIK